MKEALLAACLACHGAGGVSQTPLVPSIAAQPPFFVMAQLFLFREGRRSDPAMVAAAKGLSDDDLRNLSEAVSKLAPPPPAQPRDRARFERGAAIAQERRCGSCHEPDFGGREQMPRLANQREDYLLKALHEYRSGKRIGYSRGMEDVLRGLSDEDLGAIAHFLATLPRPAPGSR